MFVAKRPARAIAAALAVAAVVAHTADATPPQRSKAVRAEFMRQNPCPANGATKGPCPGYQVDHLTPLCIGGKDELGNLRWLSIEDHKRKTKSDTRLCRTQP